MPALEEAGVRSAIGGSWAGTAFGEPLSRTVLTSLPISDRACFLQALDSPKHLHMLQDWR